MVLGQAELLPVPREKGLVLGRVPVVDDGLVEVRRHVRVQVEGIALLGPDGVITSYSIHYTKLYDPLSPVT